MSSKGSRIRKHCQTMVSEENQAIPPAELREADNAGNTDTDARTRADTHIEPHSGTDTSNSDAGNGDVGTHADAKAATHAHTRTPAQTPTLDASTLERIVEEVVYSPVLRMRIVEAVQSAIDEQVTKILNQTASQTVTRTLTHVLSHMPAGSQSRGRNVSIYMPIELEEKLRALAQQARLPLSQYVSRLLSAVVATMQDRQEQ